MNPKQKQKPESWPGNPHRRIPVTASYRLPQVEVTQEALPANAGPENNLGRRCKLLVQKFQGNSTTVAFAPGYGRHATGTSLMQ